MIFFILGAAFALRTYRTADFLGFWYDQGRDALVIWDLWHKGKFFLIGPTTGIEGIFLGPFYYYLIAPFYLLGRGNPIFPAVWLVIINLAGIYLAYHIGTRFFSRTAGFFAAVFLAFSWSISFSHRWLSNPTPLPFFALLTILSLLHVINGRRRWWWLLGLAAGLSLHLEAASATFFLPSILVVLLWRRKHLKASPRDFLISFSFFGLTLLPQIVFDFRHGHLLFNAFRKFLIADSSFQPRLTELLTSRLRFYFDIFTNKFFLSREISRLFVVILTVLAFSARRRLPKIPTLTLLVWWLVPVISLLFYHGNNGYVWDYYFTGVFPVMVILVASVLASAFSAGTLSRLTVIAIIGIFLYHNFWQLGLALTRPHPGSVTLSSSLAAVDWVYQDTAGLPFNTDVYVPPVIPYAYDYLFLWRGMTRYRHQPLSALTTRLYTLYEPDGQHPQFLDAWLARQATIGSVEETVRFNSITVSRRHRFKLSD